MSVTMRIMQQFDPAHERQFMEIEFYENLDF